MRHMLTTVDNPFDPWTNWDSWYTWDEAAGYHSTSFLARVTRSAPTLSDSEQDEAEERAIDEIVRENVSGMWKKVPEPATAEPSAA